MPFARYLHVSGTDIRAVGLWPSDRLQLCCYWSPVKRLTLDEKLFHQKTI